MTIISHPWLKLLLAIIAAIVVGISSSWGWGIATFFIAMFCFIWVADWLFSGTIKSKVEVNDELETLLDKLERIGNIKNYLPFEARRWCNSLGLFVQSRDMKNMVRLQAGNSKYLSKIYAWLEGVSVESGLEWKVVKYEPGDWEKSIDPTLEIALWLMEHNGVPQGYEDFLSRAIDVYKKEGYLKFPRIDTPKPKLPP